MAAFNGGISVTTNPKRFKAGHPEGEETFLDPWGVHRRDIELTEYTSFQTHSTKGGIRKQPFFSMHYALEIGIVMDGVIRRFYHNAQFDLGAGDVWFCGTWEPHAYQLIENPGIRVVAVALPTALASTHVTEMPNLNFFAPFTVSPDKRPQTNDQNRDEILDLGRQLQNVPGRDRTTRVVLTRLKILELLALLMEDWREARVAPAPESYASIMPALDKVFRSRDFVSADEAARVCRMNRSKFSPLFARFVGMSFSKFALRHRLAGAAQQIAKSDEPLKAIAYDWGFADASHLRRCFADHYRCAPSEFRERFGQAAGEAGAQRLRAKGGRNRGPRFFVDENG